MEEALVTHDGPGGRAMETMRYPLRGVQTVGYTLLGKERKPSRKEDDGGVPPPRTLPPLLGYYYTCSSFISAGQDGLFATVHPGARQSSSRFLLLSPSYRLLLLLLILFFLRYFIFTRRISADDLLASTSTWTRMQIDAACPQLSFINIPHG